MSELRAPWLHHSPDCSRASAASEQRLFASGDVSGVPWDAAGVLAARCLRDAGAVEDAALLAAARSLDCRTLYGDFRLDPATGLQVGHEVLTVQWQGGARRIVWPPKFADRSLIFPRFTR